MKLKRVVVMATVFVAGLLSVACLCMWVADGIAKVAAKRFCGVDTSFDKGIFGMLERNESHVIVLDFKNGDWIRMMVVDNPQDNMRHLFYAISSDGGRVKKCCLVDRLQLPSGEFDVRLRAAKEESCSLSEFWRNPRLRSLGVDMRDNFDGPLF